MEEKRKLSKKKASHPGEILFEEFMKARGISAGGLALALHVTSARISEILNKRRGITAETALRLSKFFGTTAEFWFDLQRDYELSEAEEKWSETINLQVRPLLQAKMQTKQKPIHGNSKAVLSKLTPSQKKIYNLISEEPIHFDILCDKLQVGAGELSADLTLMELSNVVKRSAGNYYST